MLILHSIKGLLKSVKNYSKSRLGMAFEEQVARSNAMYEQRGQALIIKAHTQVKVKSKNNEITSAKFGEKAPVDFIGVVNGLAVAFDAKSTQETTKFPYANIAQHQLEFMRKFQLQGGRAFLLVHFAKHFETYLLDFYTLTQQMQHSKYKYVPYTFFKENCKLVTCANLVECDWIAALEG